MLAFSYLRETVPMKSLFSVILLCIATEGMAGSFWKNDEVPLKEVFPAKIESETIKKNFHKTPMILEEISFWKKESNKKQPLRFASFKALWQVYHKYIGYKGEPILSEFDDFVTDYYNSLHQKVEGASEGFIVCETILEARLYFSAYGKPSKPIMSYAWEPEVSEESLLSIKNQSWKRFNPQVEGHWDKGDFPAAIDFLKESSKCLINPRLKCDPEDIEHAVQFISITEDVYYQALKQGLDKATAFCYAMPYAIQSKQLYYHQLHQTETIDLSK